MFLAELCEGSTKSTDRVVHVTIEPDMKNEEPILSAMNFESHPPKYGRVRPKLRWQRNWIAGVEFANEFQRPALKSRVGLHQPRAHGGVQESPRRVREFENVEIRARAFCLSFHPLPLFYINSLREFCVNKCVNVFRWNSISKRFRLSFCPRSALSFCEIRAVACDRSPRGFRFAGKFITKTRNALFFGHGGK